MKRPWVLGTCGLAFRGEPFTCEAMILLFRVDLA
jgi:hypothetical protein